MVLVLNAVDVNSRNPEIWGQQNQDEIAFCIVNSVALFYSRATQGSISLSPTALPASSDHQAKPPMLKCSKLVENTELTRPAMKTLVH